MKYLICEVGGKQFKITPNQPFDVELETQAKEVEAKVLLSVGDKIELGKPYLKDSINLKVLGTHGGEKVRVAKFHSKANYRRVTGHRKQLTKFVLESNS